jgi:hypothetical protein
VKLANRKVASLAREIAGHASVLESQAVEICNRANSDCDDGIRGTDYSAVRRGGSEGTVQEVRAMHPTKVDPVGKMAGEFNQALHDALRAVKRARELGENLTRLETSEKASEQGGQSSCMNCGRWVSGSPEDRVRAGRCFACWRYWDRSGRDKERPREMRTEPCPTTRTSYAEGNLEVPCSLPAGHAGEHVFTVSVAS